MIELTVDGPSGVWSHGEIQEVLSLPTSEVNRFVTSVISTSLVGC